MNQNKVSKVWNIPSMFGASVPGVLVYAGNRLLFITEEGIQFNIQMHNIGKVTWPLLRMGLGFDAVIAGKKYKFSFSKPNPNAPDIRIINGSPYPSVAAESFFAGDDLSLASLKSDKLTARFWKDLLANRF